MWVVSLADLRFKRISLPSSLPYVYANKDTPYIHQIKTLSKLPKPHPNTKIFLLMS